MSFLKFSNFRHLILFFGMAVVAGGLFFVTNQAKADSCTNNFTGPDFPFESSCSIQAGYPNFYYPSATATYTVTSTPSGSTWVVLLCLDSANGGPRAFCDANTALSGTLAVTCGDTACGKAELIFLVAEASVTGQATANPACAPPFCYTQGAYYSQGTYYSQGSYYSEGYYQPQYYSEGAYSYSQGYYEGYYEPAYYSEGYYEAYYEGPYYFESYYEPAYYSEGYYEGYYEGFYYAEGYYEPAYYSEGGYTYAESGYYAQGYYEGQYESAYYTQGGYYSQGAYGSMPPCPLAPRADRYIASLNRTIVAHQTLANATSGPVSFSVPTGRYNVTLVSWDPHSTQSGSQANQPQEIWFARVFDGSGATIVDTPMIADLATVDDMRVQTVMSGYNLDTPTGSVSAIHGAYPNSGANGITPVCVVFDRFVPITTGIIRVNVTGDAAGIPIAPWSLSGAENISGSGPSVLTNKLAGTWTISTPGLAGWVVTVVPPAGGNLPAGGLLTFNLNIVRQTGCMSVTSSIDPAGSWSLREEFTGNIIDTASGSKVYNNLPTGDYTVIADDVPGYDSPTPNPQTVAVTASGSCVAVSINYNLAALNPPVITGFDNQPCGHINLFWQDNSGNENGFIIYRRTATGTPVEIKTMPTNSSSYDDPSSNNPGTDPVEGETYWYQVVAFANAPFYREAPSAEFGPILNIQCLPIISVDVSLDSVLTAPVPPGTPTPYTSSLTINDGNVLRFKISFNNTGTAPGNITYISDVMTPNLVAPPGGLTAVPGCASPSGPWHLCVDKNGNGIYNESGETAGVSGASPSLTFDVSGLLPPTGENWVVIFDARVQSLRIGNYDVISNEGCVHFSYAGTPDDFVCDRVGPLLIRTSKARAPEFQEVNP